MARYRKPMPEGMEADIRARLLTDLAIAEKYGWHRNTVAATRGRLGVDIAQQSKKVPLSEEHLLGTVPDSTLAEKWGTDRANVSRYRLQRGIAAYGRPPHRHPDTTEGLEDATRVL